MAIGVTADLETMNDQNIIIGQYDAWGATGIFGVSQEDQRQHLYVIGKTGVGKTTLLRNLILQHIQAGHGVGVIDPHGDLAEELLHHIPPARADHADAKGFPRVHRGGSRSTSPGYGTAQGPGARQAPVNRWTPTAGRPQR